VSILYVLIPLGLILLVAAVAAFFWAVGSGQFDDMDTPAWRVVMDDDRAPPARQQGEEDER
jgi:cbb3-type cytochrome oxidase maturation protein